MKSNKKSWFTVLLLMLILWIRKLCHLPQQETVLSAILLKSATTSQLPLPTDSCRRDPFTTAVEVVLFTERAVTDFSDLLPRMEEVQTLMDQAARSTRRSTMWSNPTLAAIVSGTTVGWTVKGKHYYQDYLGHLVAIWHPAVAHNF